MLPTSSHFLAIPLASGLVALLAAAFLVPVATRIGRRWRVLDVPDHRKTHRVPTPRTGGIAVAGGMTAGLLAAALLGAFSNQGEAFRWNASIFLIATGMVFLVGLADDVLGSSVRLKFIVQLVAAVLVVTNGRQFDIVTGPLGNEIQVGFFGLVIALLWIVGITNAVNLMDGLDGLAGGLVAIVAGTLAILAGLNGEPFALAVAVVTCAACIGFLPHNWQPAKIFLGDSGSLTLGFVLATLSLNASLKSSTLVAVLVPVLALGVPAIDTLLVMVVRFLESPHHPILRRFSRMFQADRTHLHHLVLELASRRTTVVLALYSLVAVCCLLAIVTAIQGNPIVGGAVLVVEIFAVLLIRWTGFRARARDIARQKRDDLKQEIGIGPKAEEGRAPGRQATQDSAG